MNQRYSHKAAHYLRSNFPTSFSLSTRYLSPVWMDSAKKYWQFVNADPIELLNPSSQYHYTLEEVGGEEATLEFNCRKVCLNKGSFICDHRLLLMRSIFNLYFEKFKSGNGQWGAFNRLFPLRQIICIANQLMLFIARGFDMHVLRSNVSVMIIVIIWTNSSNSFNSFDYIFITSHSNQSLSFPTSSSTHLFERSDDDQRRLVLYLPREVRASDEEMKWKKTYVDSCNYEMFRTIDNLTFLLSIIN